jgi:hypothetical protein
MTDLVKEIRGIPWDTLNAEQAREVFAALRVGVEAGAAWFAKFAEAFGAKAPSAPMVRAQTAPVPEPPKRGRGRPKKVSPPPTDRKDVDASPHPPVGILQGAYVSHDGPDPSRPYTLPVGHPRANGGSGVPVSGDPDFVAASQRKPEFN